jgi:hypothetical protein
MVDSNNKISDKITITIYDNPDARAIRRSATFTEKADAAVLKDSLNGLVLELQQQNTNTHTPGLSF